ncbi:MAG: HupE/UreJ family protein [Planctomycetes bacterium]|nr:HupE/UreJ family protein [Planctomycetota bacterium]
MLLAILTAIVALGGLPPSAPHPMPDSRVLLRFEPTSVAAQLDLPIIELMRGIELPLPMDAVATVRDYGPRIRDYVLAHVRPVAPDGRPWTVAVLAIEPVVEAIPDVRLHLRLAPPAGAPVDRFTLRYDVIFHQLITHKTVVAVARDWRNGLIEGEGTILGEMRDVCPSLEIDRSGGSLMTGLLTVGELGVRHIAEGVDHLLFLLALLIVAPVAMVGRRWRERVGVGRAIGRIVRIATAFTLGHSLTLAAGVFGWLRLSANVVEPLIALSILVSAVNGVRPILRGREATVAGLFGLVHGLAFAAILADLELGGGVLAASLLAFNVGIELVQLLVIVLAMPWLVLLARTRVYPPFRLVASAAIAVVAAAWFLERTFAWDNPIGERVDALADHPLAWLAGIVLLALAANALPAGGRGAVAPGTGAPG